MSVSPFGVLMRTFASASGSDKMKVFFGLTRQYSLRDRRIKSGPPRPRKVPFHRSGIAPPGTKYFCRDFKNPTLNVSNASFSIEYRPFRDVELLDKCKSALSQLLPGCTVYTMPVERSAPSFKVSRLADNRTVFETGRNQIGFEELKTLIANARQH